MSYKNDPESNYVTFKAGATDYEKWQAYFYPQTWVLKNLQGIKDEDELERFENVTLIMNSKKLNNIKQTFDTEHIKNIHKTLFDGIYSWAGDFREVNMTKNDYDFLEYDKIPEALNSVMVDFKNLEKVKDNPDQFSDELCKAYLKLNDVHPFREGNGRTQNQFVKQVCEKNGYELDLQKAMKEFKHEMMFDYYALFIEYNETKDHSEIKKYLFDRNLVKKEIAIDKKKDLALNFKKSFDKVSENNKQKTDNIKQNCNKIS